MLIIPLASLRETNMKPKKIILVYNKPLNHDHGDLLHNVHPSYAEHQRQLGSRFLFLLPPGFIL